MNPKAIGHYEIKYVLGEGGIGRVYAALDQELGRMVAIKALKPEFGADTSFVERFRGEAANLARLSHPNITTLYTLHREGRELFMVMELVDGHTLEDVLAQARRLGPRASLAVVAQTAAGLSYAHAMGVIHRDIKPANLMLTRSGLLKIMDFGIARVRGSQRMTRAGSIIGTLAYVAPEQIRGEEGDEQTDLYSLGCVLYEMLSGNPPFSAGTEYELIRAQVEAPPPPLADRLPGLDRGIETVLLAALAKTPGDRPASVEAFSRALGAAAIAGEAAAIVRDDILSAHARAPAPPTRAVELPPTPPDRRSGGDRPAARPLAQNPPRPPPGWLPAALLGGTALVLVAVITVIALDLSRPPAPKPPPVAEVTPPRPPPPAPPPIPPPQGNGRTTVPESSTIVPAPDAGPTIPTEPSPPRPAPPSAEIVKGVVTAFNPEGWPVIEGHVLRLVGVESIPPAMGKGFADWIASQGRSLDCRVAAPGGAYRCLTATGFDVSATVLRNGAARASADATRFYRDAEQQARDGRRGIWQ